MGHRCQICDHAHANTQRLDCTNCSFPTRTRSLNEQFNFLKTHLLGGLHGLLGCHSCSEWGALARSFEASGTGAAPANSVALQIRDGHDGVIEGRKDVHLSCRNLAFDLTRSGRSPRCTCLFCHNSSSLNLYMSATAGVGLPLGRKGTPSQACCSVHYYFLVAPRRRPRPATVRLGPLRVRALVRVF